MKQTLFDILVVLIVPLLIVVGYFAIHTGGIQDTWLLVTGSTTNTQNLGERSAQALAELERIKLDSTIFTWKEFKTMKFAQPVVKDEPIGRKNPFND